jgi:DNA polymerase-3 subunit delta
MVITITGENDFARSQELKKLVADFVSAEGDLALEQIDAEDTEFVRIQEAVTSLPFLANIKMVVLRSPSKSKEFADKAEELLDGLPETTELVLYEPKCDKRSSLYKLLKKLTDFREFTTLDAAGLQRWAVQLAGASGAMLSSGDARYLLDRVGLNQQLLAGEIEKLCLPGGTIDRERINNLTEPTPQSSIFQLIDAAVRGDTRGALRLYDEQRAMKVEPQQIIAMFSWQLHIMAVVKTAAGRSPDQIAREAKLNPYVVGKTATLAGSMPLSQLLQKIDDLLLIDLRSKRESLDLDDALKHFILNFAT